MSTTVGATLAVPQCWELLRSVEVGRLAALIDGRPEILPVNHVVDRGSLVFRTAAGSVLALSASSEEVVFEVDGYDEVSGEAWSVVVRGRTRLTKNLHEMVDDALLPVKPWHGGPKPVLVRLEPVETTGRRFPVSDPDTWINPVQGTSHAPNE